MIRPRRFDAQNIILLTPSAASSLRPPILRRVPTTRLLPRRTSATMAGAEVSGEIFDLQNYPTPLSPPCPAISKEVELRRAMSAASRSSFFVLTGDDIVFEDEWLAVVNKPSGVYCEALLSSYSALAPPPLLQLPARQDTSGLMIITKSHRAAAKLVEAFTEHRVKKTYLALCIGRAPVWGRIRISSGHGRSRFGAWRVYSTADVGRTLPGGSRVKHMATSFELLALDGREVRAERAEETVAAVEKAGLPESGRTHQIRLHCQYLAMPIKGDVKYGGVHEWEGEECDFHALHAESLMFEHPVTGLPLQFQSPLPPWAREASRGVL
ncbi:unnamed protein product [Spirodela intermedia]|uniref:Pseudouridine synthase RsuA/RluA-like domain-containing protein n=1 Tax=Spirodela intermedia TaxID=51605 RepID=A0A7I8I9L3_SPIIN|nr:unnamed protein product [Spirodela intermedia]CAA6654396.1 unnamed protein product [Spirodela intermedia]